MSAVSSDLDFLLDPASVAIVGASDNPDKIGGRPIFYMRKHGYRGTLYPVNPQRAEVQGEKTWPSIASLPQAPDLAIIAVPGQKAVEAVDECAARGVKGAIVISAGFSEVGAQGRAIQDAMTQRARQAGMRIVGPNTQGLANFGTGAIACFSTMFLEIEPKDGPVAVISQSGGMSAMIYGLLRQRGVGVRHMHATGNQADVTVSDLARAVLDDSDVRIILLYLESLQDPDALAQAAALARRQGVPIIAVKAGRSEAGLRAAASHTGALANEDRAVSAFFEHHGIVRAKDPQELVRYAELFMGQVSSGGPRVVIISNSGASCVLASDAADEHGLQVAPLSGATQQKLSGFLSDFATTNNPVDITAALLSNNRLFGDVLGAVSDDPAADMFVIDIPVAGRGYDVASFANDTARFAHTSGKPVAVVAWQQPVAQAFRARGVPVYDDEQQAMAALAALTHYGRTRAVASAPAHVVKSVSLPAAQPGMLSEHQSLSLLASNGIPVVPHALVSDADQAVSQLTKFGTPVVLKACSAEIPHKSEHGLVALGLNNEASVRAAFDKQAASLQSLGVKPEGWIVAPMRKGLREMMLGMNLDPVFGPVVVFGAGGKYVEAMPDVAVLLAPCTIDQVMEKLRGLRMWPLLQGVRGEPTADVQAFAEMVVQFARFAQACGSRIKSVDINPVMVGARNEGVVAVDALVELAG
jgi:acyl-CoA synthetase (NDP forming)